MKKMFPVVHFEIPATDRKRISEFYTKAFGWKSQMLGEEMGDYTLVTTTETDEKGWPKQVGQINGGFYMRQEGMPDQYPNIVIAVEDIEQSMQDITNAGGKVLGDPMEIPGYGTFVSFQDSEGNRNAIIQPPAM